MLIFIFIIWFKDLSLSFAAPFKIKTLSIITLSILITRYIALFILCLAENIKLLYFFKPFYFASFIAVPVLILCTIYIIFKNNKINFLYVFLLEFIALILYIITLYYFNIVIKVDSSIGFIMLFNNESAYYLYLIEISIILLLILYLGNIKNFDKAAWISAAAIVLIIEILLIIMKIRILPEYLAGELITLIVFGKALNMVKKQ
ncbi:hypothetical protein [Clostridium sp. JN-9]|uniref:hypothetical protein n=1 Tax=Clostridium sp. JN-9 TaxID=2507159 RepID=UPI000FFE0107|nr:hypothetical protein [Clostridium sp. JN-9]QAT39032.1 hypothetical protein EQM05_01475 [Clostridium sp. JN-9]